MIRVTRPHARGFTLVEAIVTVIVALAVLGSILAFFYNSQTWSKRSTAHAVALTQMRIGLARIARELREGHQVLYPAIGRRSQPGLGLVNARGETVFFSLVQAPNAPVGAPYDLVRQRVGGAREVLLRNLTRLFVTTSDPGRGRDPVLVRIIVTRVLADEGVSGDEGLSLVTSVAVRGVRPRCLALR